MLYSRCFTDNILQGNKKDNDVITPQSITDVLHNNKLGMSRVCVSLSTRSADLSICKTEYRRLYCIYEINRAKILQADLHLRGSEHH